MLTKIKNLFNKDPDKKEEVTAPADETALNGATAISKVDAGEQPVEKNASTETASEEKSETPSKHSTEEIKEEVIKVLKTCYDPEIPVDVWELGLIYDIKVATNGDVLIVMTLTSPSCPVAGILPGEIEKKVKDHPMVNDCKVELTFDPPWSQRMMSEVAKLELGFM